MILLTPVLELIHAQYPEQKFDFLIFQGISAQPIKSAAYVGKIYYGGSCPLSMLLTLHILRKAEYDVAIVTSGVNALKGSAFCRLLHAKTTVGDYSGMAFAYYTKQRPFKPQISRTAANYALFGAIFRLPDYGSVSSTKSFVTRYYLKATDEEYALEFINANFDLQHPIVAIHPGCNRKNKYRRWDAMYFVDLIRKLSMIHEDWQFLLIAGPDEEEEGDLISSSIRLPYLKQVALSKVAAVISKCSIMINTDSGLGHIASCFGLEIYTIFGPGDERQTAAFAPDVTIIRKAISCAPCVGKQDRQCAIDCLKQLQPQDVFDAIEEKQGRK